MTEVILGNLVEVSVDDGKYTFIQRGDGSTYALSYGEPWMESCQVPGANMWLAMAHRIEELQNADEARALDIADSAMHEAEKIAVAVATNSGWGIKTDNYARIYQAALAGALRAFVQAGFTPKEPTVG